ncbi:hypothetical protein GQ53DRAFT_309047 [Thozetella sp. PMI_491]|nr:hypothetical protein GQ53DRAFT_309047 [Thozetella sp. PMI_491]
MYYGPAKLLWRPLRFDLGSRCARARDREGRPSQFLCTCLRFQRLGQEWDRAWESWVAGGRNEDVRRAKRVKARPGRLHAAKRIYKGAAAAVRTDGAAKKLTNTQPSLHGMGNKARREREESGLGHTSEAGGGEKKSRKRVREGVKKKKNTE